MVKGRKSLVAFHGLAGSSVLDVVWFGDAGLTSGSVSCLGVSVRVGDLLTIADHGFTGLTGGSDS